MTCRTGFIIYLGTEQLPSEQCNAVAWGTKRPKIRVASSTASELLALVALVKTLWRYVYFIESLWGNRPPVHIYIDSQALSQQLGNKGSCQEEPRLNPQLKYVAQNVNAMGADVVLVSRDEQRADLLTKISKWW
eukprot:GHVU01111106.1.p1 GENE.GHVU01111106.1~~GHVU01111106.1.p1  ORF type:complete len:134 (-),score=6.67 GHVU01111106.1:509-910(-)